MNKKQLELMKEFIKSIPKSTVICPKCDGIAELTTQPETYQCTECGQAFWIEQQTHKTVYHMVPAYALKEVL